ncbi:MAG: DCC1-like thiol-disulfide oxidoreductase family protein [Cyclobacteriaceae bacterium]|nr:DCC1-like thiol-disulfide oxidoreductase family protein [Cyclobacteriaceae bacterium]
MKKSSSEEKLIIYFDGFCGLCNGFINLLLKIDSKDKLRFCPIQNDKAIEFFRGKIGDDVDSIIVRKGEDFLIKSEAVYEVFRHLGGGWKFILVSRVFPLSWRDGFYDWVAARRYKVFGKRESCRMPTKEERKKFL